MDARELTAGLSAGRNAALGHWELGFTCRPGSGPLLAKTPRGEATATSHPDGVGDKELGGIWEHHPLRASGHSASEDSPMCAPPPPPAQALTLSTHFPRLKQK